MNALHKRPFIIAGIVAAVAAVLGLAIAAPAQASGGWGFGLAFGQTMVASCTSYNVIPMRVDVPQGSLAGYATGRLSNARLGTIRKPAFGVETIYNVGSPTLAYLVFNPPEGSVDGDIFHVSLTLSPNSTLTPTVGHFEFSYRCSTGEIIYTGGPTGAAFNIGYGDSLVMLTRGKDTLGNPDVEAWCLDPQGYTSTVGLTLSKSTLAGLPAHPANNALIDRNNDCLVPVSGYVLANGEYQVTIGPDPHGVVDVIFFTGLTATNVHFLQYNVNQQFSTEQ